MSVLIKGMEMPVSGDDYVAIVIYGDGTIRSVHGFVIDGATAVSVPPHVRLIDADLLCKYLKKCSEYELNKETAPFSWSYAYDCLADLVEDMPIINLALEVETGE